jgi:ABC-type branched-subunit amino acid transport system ATPase component
VAAALAGWRVAFVVGIPFALVLARMVNRLPEPARGAVDRRSAGADDELASIEEDAPGFGETFRVLRTYGTVFWLYLSIPLRVGGFAAFGLVFSTFLQDEFNLGAARRGLIIGLTAPAVTVSLIVTGILLQRYLGGGRVQGGVRLLFFLDLVSNVIIIIAVVGSNLPLVITGYVLSLLVGAGVNAGLYTFVSMAIPPRMRTLGFASGALWALLGVVFLPLAGSIADQHGTRIAMFWTIPVTVLGSFCLLMASRRAQDDVDRSLADALVRAEFRQRRALGDDVLLSVGHLVVELSGTVILNDVSFDVVDGELLALLGTNGAGKTTLMRSLTGLLTPSHGTLIFDGVELGGADPAKTFGLGMVYAPGAPYLYDALTVAENLRAAGWRQRRDRAGLDAAIAEALEVFPTLVPRLGVRAGELSGGERQLVNLAQALLARPRLLLLDELTLGLSPQASEVVLDAVRLINDRGTTVIFIEQSVDRALRLAQRAVYIDRGTVRFDGPAAELRDNPDVLRAAFFGDAPRKRRGAKATDNGAAVALAGEKLALHYGGVVAVDSVDVAVRTGEIVALVGPNGAGKTSLLDILAGSTVPDRGRIVLHGRDVTALPAHARARLGLGRSFQDARLWPALTVREAVATARERHVIEGGVGPALMSLPASRESETAVDAAVDGLLEQFGLQQIGERFVSELSTGMRRTLELACLMAGEPTVLLLDEPAAGIAQREIPGMAALLLDVHARSGAAMVIVEHDLPLVRRVAHRVVVMAEGAVIADGDPAKVFDEPAVQRAYFASLAQPVPSA